MKKNNRTHPRQSWTFDEYTNSEIRRAAATGIYDIRGGGSKRKLPHFDDLLFLGASMSRYPLEGYREKCTTNVTLVTKFAKKPLELDIPITIAGMSFGALSGPAKEALGRGASAAGTSTTTGDGGMTPEERGQSKYLVYQLLPSRYGMNPDDLSQQMGHDLQTHLKNYRNFHDEKGRKERFKKAKAKMLENSNNL